MVSPSHLRVDLAVDGSRALAVHDEACPEIGPVCALRAEPPQQHHTVLWLWEARVLAEYGLAPQWAAQAVFPFRLVQTRTRYTDLAGAPVVLDYVNIHHHDETLAGPGDPQLWVHHGARLGVFALSERLGVSLPLGQVQPDPEALGALGLPHEHLQFGTGTVDPLLGLDGSRTFGSWALAGFAQAQLPLYRGRFGYQAGVRVLGGLQASSALGLLGPTFRLGLTAAQEFAERWNGVVPTDDGNQGRTDLFLGAGVTVPFATDWTVSLDVRARAWGRVVGAQLELPLVVELSIGRLFHLEDGEHEDEAEGSAPDERGGERREPQASVPAGPGGGADIVDVVRAGEATALVPVAGRWTVFDFWAPWCEACKPLDRRLRALAASDPRVALRRVNIVDFDSPIALQELPGVSVLPRLRVVGPDGQTRFERSGIPDALLDDLREALGPPPRDR